MCSSRFCMIVFIGCLFFVNLAAEVLLLVVSFRCLTTCHPLVQLLGDLPHSVTSGGYASACTADLALFWLLVLISKISPDFRYTRSCWVTQFLLNLVCCFMSQRTAASYCCQWSHQQKTTVWRLLWASLIMSVYVIEWKTLICSWITSEQSVYLSK